MLPFDDLQAPLDCRRQWAKRQMIARPHCAGEIGLEQALDGHTNSQTIRACSL